MSEERSIYIVISITVIILPFTVAFVQFETLSSLKPSGNVERSKVPFSNEIS